MICSTRAHCNAIFHLLCNKKTFQLNSTRPANVNQTPMEAQNFSVLLNRAGREKNGKLGGNIFMVKSQIHFRDFMIFSAFFESSPFFCDQ